MRRSRLIGAALLLASVLTSSVAHADVPCRTSGPYEAWLAQFEREAAAKGVSQRAISEAAPELIYDQRIVNIDHGQRVFTQTFLEFSDRMAAAYRIQRGAALIKTNAAIFARIDQQYGVPAPVIVAFWALESDFGANMGKEHSLSALASLAYDCRRADRFRAQLFDALRLIDRGDLTPDEMIGSWAGELGQTQMMPSEYYQYGVDFDGDGKRNLIRSVPDVLASTANYLVGLGWKRGQPWLTEVRVPENLPWDQADLAIQLPRAKWAGWGVTLADGRALPADNLPASLLLPMGRFGPAFLVYPNFQVYLQWNNSLVYSTTAAYLATRITGAPALHRGNPPPALSFADVKDMQTMLLRAGYDVGTIDGFLGLKTRQAVKAMQIKYGLPADSYPTAELLARMRGGR
ncbi:MAG TPA: lytic murein transglycosylase [Xanthobacteraceae bacterium]|nr:lytic murein transglycosylase [Xanthobacteraceae bacterium]